MTLEQILDKGISFHSDLTPSDFTYEIETNWLYENPGYVRSCYKAIFNHLKSNGISAPNETNLTLRLAGNYVNEFTETLNQLSNKYHRRAENLSLIFSIPFTFIGIFTGLSSAFRVCGKENIPALFLGAYVGGITGGQIMFKLSEFMEVISSRYELLKNCIVDEEIHNPS